ncbi:MAG: hypothetical protein JSW71_09140 [Gemmatimonadota bacterium]|nr:MAG: hypothetical protein JSW71_09140 [Gemmatimonadota bacterium]
MTGRFFVSAGGAIAAAFGSALCCAGPTVAAAMGVSAAGLAGFLPLRPYLVLIAVGSLYYGFHLLDKEEARACKSDMPCASPTVRHRMRVALWTATGLVALFGTSPIWVRWVF